MKTINSIFSMAAVVILSASAISFVACSDGVEREASYCLKQDYRYVKDQPLVDARLVREVPNTENYNAFSIEVFDSLGIVRNSGLGGTNVHSVLNINSGEDLGSFCPTGRGPKDMSLGVMPIDNPHYVDGELVAGFYDVNRNKIFVWNISRSIRSGYTEYESVEEQPKLSERIHYPYVLNDQLYLHYTQGEASSYVGSESWSVRSPKIQLRRRADLSLEREYDIFVDTLKQVKWEEVEENPIGTPRVAPSGDKIVFYLSRKPQINILDVQSGELVATRIKGEKVADDAEHYYTYTLCDEKYIYLHYPKSETEMGTSTDEMSEYFKVNKSQIHVFDYDGNLVGRYKLDGLYSTISVYDGKLYAHVHYSGRLTEYDLGLK
ncbi:MAG: hypothetical protein IKU88_07175 [Alistipes sp.]|nr:hypothetical protein [Alistipes sp.]